MARKGDENGNVECPNCCGVGGFSGECWKHVCELCDGSGRVPWDWNIPKDDDPTDSQGLPNRDE